MKQEEIRKCTKVVELFRSMMDELGDMCVVYDVRFGFIVLEYYMDGYFENNSNYDNVEDFMEYSFCYHCNCTFTGCFLMYCGNICSSKTYSQYGNYGNNQRIMMHSW